MPTYDYKCKACGVALEFFQSMSESPKRKCPECGALKLERQIGAGAGILFKGSGFYETDYRSSDYDKARKADTAAPKAKDGGDAKSGSENSKPAASEPKAKPEAKGKSAKKPD